MGTESKCVGLSGEYLHPAASFAVASDVYLCVDSFVQFLAVGDDAYAAVGLTSNVLQLFKGGHDAVEVFLVEGAEPFVNEEDVDIKVGSVK